MIRVSQSLLRALKESIGKGWFNYRELRDALGSDQEAFYTLLEGYALGLFRIRGENTFEIREEGLRLLEAWRLAGEPGVDPWIDSRVYTMLRTHEKSQAPPPGEWRRVLGDRGLLEGDQLLPAALQVLELAERLERGIVITKAMARSLASAPTGPAPAKEYGRFLPVYEAMGLAVGSLPLNPYYSLTRPGRLLRAAVRRLNLDVPLPSVVNQSVLDALERASRGEELTPEEKTLLGTLGYLKPTGTLDTPGRLVLRAVQALRAARLRPPMALSRREEQLLRAVVELWREKEAKPNLLITRERIAEKYREITGEQPPRDLTVDLYHLESLGLVVEGEEDAKQVFLATETGRELASYPGFGEGATPTAVRAITYPYAGLAPSLRWIDEAVKQKVLGIGGPTRKGETLVSLSGRPRKPLLTRHEMLALQRIPDRKSVSLDTVMVAVERAGGDPEVALVRMEARGLIELLPDNRVALTEAGRLLKIAVLGVPSGIATPIYPALVRVLEAIASGITDISEIVNRTGLSLGTVRDALVIMRQAKYVEKRMGLTSSGRALLEAARILGAGWED